MNRKIFGMFIVILFLQSFGFAQLAQTDSGVSNLNKNSDNKSKSVSKDKWTRIQSDNGEFSIELPDNFSYFFDEEGFSRTYKQKDYRLKNMNLLTSFQEGTLLRVEIYEGKEQALKSILRDDKQVGKYSEIKNNKIRIRQILNQSDNFYAVRKHFNSKNHIYILTAASRSGETPAIKRFFDSLHFEPNREKPSDPQVLALSKLSRKQISLNFNRVKIKAPNKVTKTELENNKKILFINRPAPSYVKSARKSNETGTIVLRLYFGRNGLITEIDVIKTLSDDLLRQAVFAAIRISYLPPIENDEAQAVSKRVMYTFSIY